MKQRDQQENAGAPAPARSTKETVGLVASRRGFLRLGARASAAAAVGASATLNSDAQAKELFSRKNEKNSDRCGRAQAAFHRKRQAAATFRSETLELPDQLDNGDEALYASDRYIASFSKTLPCNAFGEVNPAAFEQLRRAMHFGRQEDFDAICRAGRAERKLANPQGAFRFEAASLDSHATRIAPSHSFDSLELAGEMVEVYWQALLRDVPFKDFESDPRVGEATGDLNSLHPIAMPAGRRASSANLFRGETSGDLVGPYISQFLWQPFRFGPLDVVQQYAVPAAGLDFLTDVPSWRRVQRGRAPAQELQLGASRFLFNGRSLGEYVHRDVTFQAYVHAALILLSYGPIALDEGNPYRDGLANEAAFTSLGAPHVLDLVTRAANLALGGAWFQKWRVHRMLRPEALGGRVHFNLTAQRSYPLAPELENSRAVGQLLSTNGTALLPIAFPEGSPIHPSYPAGHACIAGACVTVLKALFSESFAIPRPVEANRDGTALLPYDEALTVGGELDKLANNISLGRDAAGVHYRQDGLQGLLAGEQQAISLLREQSLLLRETGFDGFRFTPFQGAPQVTIRDGAVARAGGSRNDSEID